MAGKSKAAVIFEGSQPERVRKAVRELGGPLVDGLADDLSAAFRGSYEGARRYVVAYTTLADRLLREAGELRPDLVVADPDGHITFFGVKAGSGGFVRSVLEDTSTQAPFAALAVRYDLGDAVALELTNHARALLGYEQLRLGSQKVRAGALDELAARRFLLHVRHHLNQLSDDPLMQVTDAFQLSKTELGSLFGVSRQAIDSWLRNGVPAERREKLNTLAALAELLERKLRPGRLPGVARTPADAYGGLTMLEMVTRDRHRELLEDVRESFDWSSAA